MDALTFCRVFVTCAACLQSPGCIWVPDTNISPCRGEVQSTLVYKRLSSNFNVIHEAAQCPTDGENDTNLLFIPRVPHRFSVPHCNCRYHRRSTQEVTYSTSHTTTPNSQPTQIDCAELYPPQRDHNWGIIIFAILVATIVGTVMRPHLDKITVMLRQRYQRSMNRHSALNT